MNTVQWDADTLLKISGSYWESFTLHAAVKLGIFTIIGDEQLTVDEIAIRMNGNKRGVAMLLNALTAMGILHRQGNRYANTPTGLLYLSKNSDEYLGHIIMHHHHLVDSWSQLDQAVKTGAPVRVRASFGEEGFRESFLMGMYNIAKNLAPRVVDAIDLSRSRHLLDLGGGTGTYAIYFCLKNPHLRATVFDLPSTEPFARRMIERFGLKDRINFVAGDYVEENIPGSYDVAWLSQILHAEDPDECRKIINKTVSVLRGGGVIIVHDFLLDDTMDGPLRPALFSLNMLVGTEGGKSYSEGEIIRMLADAGVRDVRRIPFQSPGDSGIILGYVQELRET